MSIFLLKIIIVFSFIYGVIDGYLTLQNTKPSIPYPSLLDYFLGK